MIADHDAIDELLAGYILRALEGPDAQEADRLLAEHVPDCATCRTTLTDLQAVTGDLAVSVAPLAPPEMLLPRLTGELEPRRTRRLAGWSPARLVAAAAAVVVLVGIAGLAVTSADGEGQTLAQADLAQIRSIAALPGAETTDLGEADEVTAPDREATYVMGTGVASPPSGMIYRLWAVGSVGHELPRRFRAGEWRRGARAHAGRDHGAAARDAGARRFRARDARSAGLAGRLNRKLRDDHGT